MDDNKLKDTRVLAPLMGDDGLNSSDHGLWVFGYGSLMWRPGFPFVGQVLGRCSGVRRSFCVWSVHHRGSRLSPGLVLGLEEGGTCEGVLFYVAGEHKAAVIGYLRAREQVTSVYKEVYRRVELLDGSGRSVRALSYLTDRGHAQYAGCLPLARQAEIIKRARGRSGFNLDYLNATVRSLDMLQIHDPLLKRVQVMTGCRHKLSACGDVRYPTFRL